MKINNRKKKFSVSQFIRDNEASKNSLDFITHYIGENDNQNTSQNFKIKTIVGKVKHSSAFDHEVNFYLKFGYILETRYAEGKYLIAELVKYYFKPMN